MTSNVDPLRSKFFAIIITTTSIQPQLSSWIWNWRWKLKSGQEVNSSVSKQNTLFYPTSGKNSFFMRQLFISFAIITKLFTQTSKIVHFSFWKGNLFEEKCGENGWKRWKFCFWVYSYEMEANIPDFDRKVPRCLRQRELIVSF